MPRTQSDATRSIAEGQADSSLNGGLFLNNKDRIKLSHAFVNNTRLANKQKKKEDEASGIATLTETILAAADGQPLGTSITAQKEGQANAKLLLQFLIGKQQQEQEEASGMATPEKGRTPQKVTTKSSPGGPSTPGAKAAKTGLSEEQFAQLLELLAIEQKNEEKKLGSNSAK